mgnify:CR=1 FL=1
MNTNIITRDYYDNTTYTMLLKTITDDDKEYMKTIEEQSNDEFIYKRWNIIINSLPHNYYNQYYLQTNSKDRNEWFSKYLDLPSKNMLDMPEIL